MIKMTDAPEDMPADQLLDRDAAAAFLNVTRRWLEIGAVRGYGPAYIKLGRQVRYQVGDLRAFIETQRVAHSSEATVSKVGRLGR